MKRIEFNCYDDLVGTMQTLIECSSEDEYKVVEVVAKYDVIKNLLRELILYGEDINGLIDLERCEYSYYDKEFLLYLTEDGVSVERAWYKNEQNEQYYASAGDVVFIHEDCNSKVLEYIESDVILEFGFVENNLDECDCFYDGELEWADCPCCCGCEEKRDRHGDVDEKTHNITEPSDKTNTDVAARHEEQYFVNGKYVSKDEYEKFSKEFNEKMKETFDNFNTWSICTKSLLNMFDNLNRNMKFID